VRALCNALDLAKEGQAFTAAWLLGKCWEDDVISPAKKKLENAGQNMEMWDF